MPVCWLRLIFSSLVVVLADETANLLPKQSVRIGDNTRLVIFGSRHGNRHPGKFLDENPRTWGFEGDYELTQFGKREGFGFGRELREFLGSLVSNNYVRHEAELYTSSANRCQMTLQVIMAGFYPPDTFAEWNHALEWTPVPYTIDDTMLRMYAVRNCPASEEAWEPINTDRLHELANVAEKNAALLEYISEHTGWNASIESAGDLADNLAEIDLYNSSLPWWIENPSLDAYNRSSMKQAIMSFLEMHTVACSKYAPCRDLIAGTWLHHLLDILQAVANGEKPRRRLVGYVSHLEATLSLMNLIGINRTSLSTSAGFVIEYRDQPDQAVRLLLHEPVVAGTDWHIIYLANYSGPFEEYNSDDRWIPFDAFYNELKNSSIADWEVACGRMSSQCALADDVNGTSPQAVRNHNLNSSARHHQETCWRYLLLIYVLLLPCLRNILLFG